MTPAQCSRILLCENAKEYILFSEGYTNEAFLF